MSESYGARHRIDFQFLVYCALNETRQAFTSGLPIDRHIMALYWFAVPLFKKNPTAYERWCAVEAQAEPFAGERIPLEIRNKQIIILTDLFWEEGVLTEHGVPVSDLDGFDPNGLVELS